MSDQQQSLFASQDDAVLYFDGGSRGNPGPAAYGYVLERSDGEPLALPVGVEVELGPGVRYFRL